VIPELGCWLEFFRSREDRVPDLPWSDELPPTPSELRRIARSIATFQLGESSDGAHLIAAAGRIGRERGLAEIEELTELFIREEQFHASLLAAFMKAYEIPLLRTEWSDRVFRSLRHQAGFEAALCVLIVAELIALTYYRALAAATGSAVLRQICDTIVSDELEHVAYESTVLLRLRASRRASARLTLRWLHALLYAGAVAVVFLGHRPVLRAGGYGFSRFWSACWNHFTQFVGRASAPREPGWRI